MSAILLIHLPWPLCSALSAFLIIYLSFSPMEERRTKRSFLLLLLLLHFCQPIFAVDFLFNGFNPNDLLLYGNAAIDSRILTLTNRTSFAVGRAIYETKVRTKTPGSSHVLPFSTSFIFSIAPYRGLQPGHGIVFIFVPNAGIAGTSSAQHLGLFNRSNNGDPSNHVFGVEFDVFANQEFNDIDDNHVGVDVNSLTSVSAHTAGYFMGDSGDEDSFRKLRLNSGENYQAWIDYRDSTVNVTISVAGMKRPEVPLLSVNVNLSGVLVDEMFVGFTAATGRMVEGHRILGWSFSNSNFSLSDGLITDGLPSFVLPKTPFHRSRGFVAGIAVVSFVLVCLMVLFAVFLLKRKETMARERAEMEDWELEYWPHRMTYREIESATRGFAEENVIGIGGNGKVYKGVLPGGAEVAIKRISHENDGLREFLAEIASIGRLKHRNLVRLRGWCKKERGVFMLVYDYMENGSLEKRIHECDDSNQHLRWEERIRILKDVAVGILYLHEGWEAKVVHRDIKASNVLLDKEMHARLGDFGLARVHGHEQVSSTTRVVGTVGYLAPEVIMNGRASTQADVYSFGILILELVCARRPLEEGLPPLVDWVWQMMKQGELLNALDVRLRSDGDGGFQKEQAEKVLQLGLVCAHQDASTRPTMRQVVKVLEGKSEGDETDNENMEAYLVQRMASEDRWSIHSASFGHGLHPTMEEIRQAHSSSMSLSWSDSLLEGR